MAKKAAKKKERKVPLSPPNVVESAPYGQHSENTPKGDRFGTGPESSPQGHHSSLVDHIKLDMIMNMPLESYRPAYLAESGDVWYIVYYAYNPKTQKLQRVRHKWNRTGDLEQRRKSASVEIARLNTKLHSGWNPFLEQAQLKGEITLESALIEYEKSYSTDRADTKRTYRSHIQYFRQWLTMVKLIKQPVIRLTIQHAQAYLQWRERTFNLNPTSVNNVLGFTRTIVNFWKQRGYIDENPFVDFKKRNEPPKLRKNIPEDDLKRIMDYLERTSPGMLLLCRLVFYCGIRPAELSRLKVMNIRLSHSIIFIYAHQSKDHDDAPITVPYFLLGSLAQHIEGADPDMYLFGPGCTCSKVPCDSRNYAKRWNTIRKHLKLPMAYQLYSLKDTGAIYISENVSSPVELRDQLRHSDLETTNRYIRKALPVANENIAKMDQVF